MNLRNRHDDYTQNQDEAIQEALKNDLYVVQVKPSSRVLQIDCDSKLDKIKTQSLISEFFSTFDIKNSLWVKSRGKGWHCYVILNNGLDDVALRLAMQAALGDDMMRFALALKRLRDTGYAYDFLFETKGTVSHLRTLAKTHKFEDELEILEP